MDDLQYAQYRFERAPIFITELTSNMWSVSVEIKGVHKHYCVDRMSYQTTDEVKKFVKLVLF